MSETAVPENNESKSVSQDEVNRIVAERVAREREKFADYEDLKAAAVKLAEIEEAQKSEAQKQAEKLSALESENRELALARDRAEVAASEGVPVDLLRGSDRAELLKSAEALKSWRGEAAKDEGLFVGAEGGSAAPVALNSDALEDSLKKALGIA